MLSILVQSRKFSQKMKTVFVPTALAVFLAACTGNKVSETLKDQAYATSEFYINKMYQTTDLEEQQTYRLLAVRKLIEENKVIEAQNTFAEMNVAKLSDQQKLEYRLITAQLYALQGNNTQASVELSTLQLNQLSQAQIVRFYQTQARIAENQKDVIETVRARSLMDNYLTDNKLRQENNDQIWALLRNANRGMLAMASAGAGEVGLAGWLALVNEYNQNMSNPSALPQVIENWKAQYPSHSATLVMPTELQNVLNFQQTQLGGVALLLPQSSDAKVLSEIIQRGFSDAKGSDMVPVKVYDTDSASIDDLLSLAASEGYQTVIGPLLKDRVNQLLNSSQVGNLNVLALNSTPNVRSVARVCYYGLSPEAEARSAAERLVRDGISHAVVAAPQGDFGYRASEAFVQRWRELTQKDADVRYFNDPFDTVTSLENNRIGAGAGLYVLASAEQVYEIKQGINSSEHLANQFPVYTSSRSNSPNNGVEFRTVMEGVKFSEIPLLSEMNSDQYKKAEKLAASDFSMMRLYAMGSDAWSIVNKFNEFRQIPGYKVSGLTGVLSAGQNCNIEREMSWLEYRGGSVVNAD